MVCSGFTIIQAYRHHADLPIEYVASRTGLTVHRVSQIEGGAIATAAETTAIHKAVGIPPQFAAAA
jgi:transcriptional regulator with XRE-family HTH domain